MAKQQSQGKCHLCNGTFGKASMSRHLAKCLQDHPPAKAKAGKTKLKKTKLFHLVVQGRYDPEYWLHLEVPGTLTLDDLDGFLRDIWLECCGHLSAFQIDEVSYSEPPPAAEPDFFGFLDEEDEDTNIELEKVLRPGLTFGYEYDFGSTTELTLKVVSEREGEVDKHADIRLLARNDAPAVVCVTCGKPARLICSQCAWGGKGWFCKACARKHKCGDEFCLPVVNSPRVGVCGYTGDAEEF